MRAVMNTWEETDIKALDLRGEPLARAAGWTFWEHPTLGDEHPVLAVTLDNIGDNGPIVYNTLDFDVPDQI